MSLLRASRTRTRYPSSTFTESGASYTDVPGVTWPVVAGTRYRVRLEIVFQSAATTTGLQLRFTAPAVTFGVLQARIPATSNSVDGFFEPAVALTANIAALNTSEINTDTLAIVEGIFQPSASGTFKLQARSETNGVQVTVQTYSVADLTRIVA